MLAKVEFNSEKLESSIITRLTTSSAPEIKYEAFSKSNDNFKRDGKRGPQASDKYNNKNYNKDGRYPPRDRQGGFGRDERPNENQEWRAEEDEMVQKLKKQSKRFMEEAKSEKQDFQRVRLWLNQISPDNFEKKSGELRELLIGNAKLMGEPGFDQAEADKLQIDDEKQTIVVEIIFRKAQKEHSYTAFYAKLSA